MTNKIQWCEVCNKPAEEVHPLKIEGLLGTRTVCAGCLRTLRKVLPDTKLVVYGSQPFQSYWLVKVMLPQPRNLRLLRPRVQKYEVSLAPWQAGLLKLAGFRIEEVIK